MRQISVTEAKAKFAALLDAVEKGETVSITRHGKCVARIVPDEGERRRRIDEAFTKLAEIGKSIKANGGSLEELMASRHEGHRY